MEITFEQLPSAVTQLLIKLDSIERLLQTNSNNEVVEDQLFTIKQASQYAHLSVPTFYGLVHRNAVPCMKKGKRLYFSKQELTEWIKEGKRKTSAQLGIEAEAIISKRKK